MHLSTVQYNKDSPVLPCGRPKRSVPRSVPLQHPHKAISAFQKMVHLPSTSSLILACHLLLLFAAPSISTSTTTPHPAKSTPLCILHKQDPDQGITQAYCVCDGSATLSPLSVPPTGHQSDSCAYTTIPATARETITTLESTYTKDCWGCVEIGFNVPSCTSIPGCTRRVSRGG